MVNYFEVDEYGNKIGLDLFGEDDIASKNEILLKEELADARAEIIDFDNVTEEIETDTEIVEEQTEETGESIWSVPMPSHNEYIKSKDVDFTVYGGLMLLSKFDRVNNMEAQRYIYKNSFKNEEVAELVEVSESTIKRNMNKLKKAIIEGHDPLVTLENTSNGVVYKLNYAIDDKYYVTISNDLLKYLIRTSNNNMIKLYIFLKVQLAEGRKQMQREFLANAIGLKGSGRKAQDTISDMTTDLVAKGLIKKYERVEFFIDEKTGKQKPKTLVSYELVPEDKWREYKEGLTIKE